MIKKNPLYTISLNSFLLSIVLFRVPYVYLIPGITNAFLTTQALARVLLVASLFFGIFIAQKVLQFGKDGKIINILLLAFFTVSSLSLFSAQNIEVFIVRYKDFVIGILAFYAFALFRNEEKKIIIAIVITMPIMIIYQLILLYGGSFTEFFTSIIYQKQLDILSHNLDRGRIYVDVFDEAFIPMIFLVSTFTNKIRSFSPYILLSFLAFLALIADFRTRIGMLFIGIIGTVAILEKKIIQKIFFLGLIFLGIATLVAFVANYTYGSSFIDRFFLSDEIEDVNTIYSRADQVEAAFQMGFISPLGVGLGNYYDNLPNNRIRSLIPPNTAALSGVQNIHNNIGTIVAESGYIALFIFFVLLFKFFIMDIKTMREVNKNKKCFVIAFWSLFFYGFFNPPIPVSYQVFFWGMRGLLIK